MIENYNHLIITLRKIAAITTDEETKRLATIALYGKDFLPVASKRYTCTCDPNLLLNDVERFANQVVIELPEGRERRRRIADGLSSGVSVDKCIAGAIKELWAHGIETVGCCCGHNVEQGWANIREDQMKQAIYLGYTPKLARRGESWSFSWIKHYLFMKITILLLLCTLIGCTGEPNPDIAPKPPTIPCDHTFPGIEVKFNKLTGMYALHRVEYEKPAYNKWPVVYRNRDEFDFYQMTDWHDVPDRSFPDSCSAKAAYYPLWQKDSIYQVKVRRWQEERKITDSLNQGWK